MSAVSTDFAAGAARGSSLNLIGAVCQQACLLLTIVVLAKTLGEADLGRYTLVYALMMILLIFSAFGFRAALTRDIARHRADRHGGGVRAVLRIALRTSAIVSVALGVGLMAGADRLAAMFGDDIGFGLRMVAVTLPALTLRELALAASQGWQSQREFALIGWIVEPIARLLLTGVALAAGGGLEGVFVVLALTTWISAAAAALALRRRVQTIADGQRVIDRRALLSFSLVSWGSTLAFTGLAWGDTVILGLLVDAQAVGVYTVATRLVSLAVFVMAPLNAVFAPQFAHLHHVGDAQGLRRAYALSTGWILRLSMPAFAALVVFPDLLLAEFGETFVAASLVTSILVVGQLVNAASGPCGTLLNMSGHVWVNMTNNIVVLAGNISLNLILVPRFGIVGAAVAWSVCLVLVNLARLLQVWLLLGLQPFGGPARHAVVAGVLVTALLAGLRPLLPGGLLGLVLALLATMALYVVASIALRFTEEEKEAFATLRRGRGR